MKTILHTIRFYRNLSLVCFAFLIGRSAGAQTIPELVFQNPVLQTGTAGADGATYLFQNVGPNLDAVVTIISRSGAGVILGNIDTVGAGMGFDKSFQPVIGMPGTAPANTNWWMKFNIAFFEAGTNKKAKMSEFNITVLDIDGDGNELYEWAEMDKISKVDSAQVNSLTFSVLANYGPEKDYKIAGIVANSPGIDTTALNVMATYTYKNKDNFDFTIGAQTNSGTTTAGMRLNSLWFKQFSWSNLPVKLVSFSAVLNKNKADLTWKTVFESNFSHFVIEKSLDGQNFNDAGIVFGKGNETDVTNYSFSDNVNPDQDAVIYYRLRSVDIDGRTELSQTKLIRVSTKVQNTISLVTYPNPAANEIRVTIPANWQRKKMMYEVITMNGQTVTRTESASSSQTEVMNIASLAPGIYFVRVNCDGQTAQQKIIKQ